MRIELTRGYFAVIDDTDADRVSQYKWFAAGPKGGPVYAARHHWQNGKQVRTYLHRFIIDAKSGTDVDHINGDRLDCRKENLRIGTHKQNMRNLKLRIDNSTGFKGVSRRGGRFRAYIAVDNRQIHLGMFDSSVEAAMAYDRAAKEYYGTFARLNLDVGSAA